MRGVNKVIIVGHLGADPDVHQFPDGNRVTSISVATSSQWTDQSGQAKEATEWHKVKLYGRIGDIAAEYLRKGGKVYIEGSLRTRKWIDDHGTNHYVTEIFASNMQMLGNSINSEPVAQEVNTPPVKQSLATVPTPPVLDDDFPF